MNSLHIKNNEYIFDNYEKIELTHDEVVRIISKVGLASPQLTLIIEKIHEREKMSIIELDSYELSSTTLRALVNSLQRNGYDLDKIYSDYNKEIMDNRLSADSPQFKLRSTDQLKSLIEEAKVNPVLVK